MTCSISSAPTKTTPGRASVCRNSKTPPANGVFQSTSPLAASKRMTCPIAPSRNVPSPSSSGALCTGSILTSASVALSKTPSNRLPPGFIAVASTSLFQSKLPSFIEYANSVGCALPISKPPTSKLSASGSTRGQEICPTLASRVSNTTCPLNTLSTTVRGVSNPTLPVSMTSGDPASSSIPCSGKPARSTCVQRTLPVAGSTACSPARVLTRSWPRAVTRCHWTGAAKSRVHAGGSGAACAAPYGSAPAIEHASSKPEIARWDSMTGGLLDEGDAEQRPSPGQAASATVITTSRGRGGLVRRRVPAEPGEDRADARGRLRGPPGQPAVRGVGHLHERRRHALQLQRLVVLLRVADGCAKVAVADHDERRRRHGANERQRRAAPVAVGVFPRQLREPVLRHVRRNVGRQNRARPVDDGLLRRGRLEAIRLADDPGGQDAAARAARDIQPVGVDEPRRYARVDGAHEVGVVVAGIAVLDQVRELFAVRRRAARIRVEHDVAGARVELHVGRERRAVRGVRPAVDLEDQRILLAAVEIGRRDEPRADRAAVEARGHGERLHGAERLAAEECVVETS